MCPLYVSGLIGPGDRKSVHPTSAPVVRADGTGGGGGSCCRIPRRWIIIAGVCLILAALPSALLNHRRPLLGELPRNFGHPIVSAEYPFWQRLARNVRGRYAEVHCVSGRGGEHC